MMVGKFIWSKIRLLWVTLTLFGGITTVVVDG